MAICIALSRIEAVYTVQTGVRATGGQIVKKSDSENGIGRAGYFVCVVSMTKGTNEQTKAEEEVVVHGASIHNQKWYTAFNATRIHSLRKHPKNHNHASDERSTIVLSAWCTMITMNARRTMSIKMCSCSHCPPRIQNPIHQTGGRIQ